MKPYKDQESIENIIIREFDSFINESELVWHRDDCDRTVEILRCEGGWMFQYDNELPFNLAEGDYIKINKDEWHRLHKGDGSLLIKIINHY